MKIFFTYLLVGFLWLLHWLPLSVLRALGWGLGRLLYALGRERRNVALINLRLCFPELSEAKREELARRHFVTFSRAVLDRTLGWWASKDRLERIIRIQGVEHLSDSLGRPLILLSPHFVGLDAGATRISMYVRGCSVFSNQKNPVLNSLLYDGRMRFNEAVLLSRQDGMRKIVKAMRDGHPFYYLPDMDFGAKESIFVPFFGVQAATIPALSRLVRLTGARVVPCITRQVPDGYEVEVMPPWENFPGESVEADTLLMNQFIESQVLAHAGAVLLVAQAFQNPATRRAKVLQMNSLNIEIRPVTPPDVPAISSLAREIWQASYPGIITQEQIDFMLEQRYGHERLYDDLEDLHKWLDQAFLGDRRVGFAFSEIYKGEFKLDKLYIHPDVQRQGVGGQLIAHVAARAKREGYPCVILAVNKRNDKAINSYKKYGFAVREAIVDDIGHGYVMDDFVMEKKL